MRKQGSLDGIILLVISFSVINYVVSKSVRLRQADTLFFMHIRAKKRVSIPFHSRGKNPPRPPRSLRSDLPLALNLVVARVLSWVQIVGR